MVDWIERLLPNPAHKKALAAGRNALKEADALLPAGLGCWLDTFAEAGDLAGDNKIAADVWRDPALIEAGRHARRHLARRARDAAGFVDTFAADQRDLDLAWLPAAQGAAPPLAAAEWRQLDGFFLRSRRDPATAAWTGLTLNEGRLYALLVQLDGWDAQAAALLAPVLAALDTQSAAGSVDANLALLALLYDSGDLAGFDAAYDRFRRQHPAGAERPVPWDEQLRGDEAFATRHHAKFIRLLRQLAIVRQMRRLADDPLLGAAINLLSRLELGAGDGPDEDKGGIRDVPAPAPVLPAPPLFGFKPPAAAELAVLDGAARRWLASLNPGHPQHARRQSVAGLWLCFVLRHALDLAACQQVLPHLAGDSEALGLLLGALRGELATLAGDYERAQLAFEQGYALSAALAARPPAPAVDPKLAAQFAAAGRLFLGRLCQWRGNALLYLADYAAARESYALAASHLPQDDPETALLQAINLGNLAFLSNNLVDHRGYVTYDKKEQILLKGDDPEPFLRLKYDKNRAALQEAAGCYQQALALIGGLPAGADGRAWQAIVKANLANLRWVTANLLREAALAAPALARQLAELGEQDTLRREALVLFDEAGALAEASGDRPLRASCLAGASELHLLLGEAEPALEAAARGLALLGAPAEGPADPLAVAAGFFPESCWRVYLTQARAFEALGRREQAAAAYERAMATVEAMRDRLRSDQWQVAALQDKLDVYQCFIHFLFHAAQGASGAANAPRILALAEQLKSRAFLDLLESARLELDDLVPAELRGRRQALLAQFSAQNTAIAQELRKAAHDEARVAGLLAAQQALAGEWRELQSAINAAVADQAGELNPPPLDLAAARALLAAEPDLVVLSYVVGDDQSYLVVADAGGESAYELPGRAALEFAVGRLVWYAQKVPLRFAEFVAANRAAVAATLGPALDDGLLARLEGKRALILPDGMLCYLPFELLLARDPAGVGQPADPAKPKHPDALGRELLPFYLLSYCPISYAQSLSVWRMLQGQRPEPSGAGQAYRALGVYCVNYAVEAPKGPGHQRAQELGIAYVDLPQTARIASVLKALDSAGESEEVLALAAWAEDRAPWPLERQSNEANFKRLLEDHSARYLIFAGHGVFNDKYPSFSGLVFNLATPGAPEPPPGAPPQDGFFGLNDLFGLRMRGTELTFLAACQGGLGMLSRGEGVNAVTRGLMYRGSPSVIASLWCVDVLATMDLVEAFFGELAAQPDADKARLLQAAKLAVADQPDQPQRAHPFYWAPFVLMGRR